LESALENWRINAAAWIARQGASDSTVPLRKFYWGAVRRIAEDPARLAEFGSARIETVQAGREVGFEDEIPLLKEIVRLAGDRTAYLEKAFEALQAKVQELVGREFKVVVFCSEPLVADEAFAYLNKRLWNTKVVRHEVIPPDEEVVDQGAPWLSFLKAPGSNVIICDRRAEEGLNLQSGRKVLIHCDLPFDPNRIEQRIGRLDRYGSGTPITSIALVCTDSRIQREWYSLLSKGLGVFQRSISSLQYLVEEKLNDLRFAFVTGGVERLKDLAADLGGKTAWFRANSDRSTSRTLSMS
jgi:ATP-dependent helicase HepA